MFKGKLVLLLALLCASPLLAQQVLTINSGVITANVSTSNSFKIQVNQVVTAINISSTGTPPSTITFIFTQDSTGHAVSGWSYAAGSINSTCTVDTTANATTVCAFQYDANSNSFFSVAGAAGSGTSLGPGQIIVTASAYGVKANAHWVQDASVTNASGVVTCPSGECNFLTTASVGQVAWSNASCLLTGTARIARTTVRSVDSDTQITLNANSNATGTACLFWGDVDDAGWQAAWTAFIAQLKNAPAVLQLPCGASIVEHGISSNPNVNINFMPTIAGCGAGTSTTILPSPSFAWSTSPGTGNTCSTSGFCFFGGLALSGISQLYEHDFVIFGGGNSGANGCSSAIAGLKGIGADANFMGLNLYVWALCPVFSGGGSFTGIKIGAPATCINCQSDAAGVPGWSIVLGGQPVNVYWPFVGDTGQGASVTGTGTLNSTGGTWSSSSAGQSFVVGSGAKVNFFGDRIDGLNPSGGNATINIHGGTILCTNGAAVGCIHFGSGGATVNLFENSTVTPSGTTQFAAEGTSGIVNDDGTTAWTAGTTGLIQNGVTYSVQAGNGVQGACTGVASAASTLGLYGTGPNVTLTTCTSTTIGAGKLMTRAGTLKALIVSAGTGGVNASSGVVTVLKNGSTTTMTCTLGTGTSCTDITHTQTYATGDLISIQFTTQAAETLANVKAVVVAQ